MNVLERIFAYAEILYQKALERFEADQFRRAEVVASAAAGAVIFVEQDVETSDELRKRARVLSKTIEDFMSAIWKEETERYGERFLSGSKKHPEDAASKEAALFMCDLRVTMGEVERISRNI
jgi:hypothetical protein